jgi:hypothetical protein
MTRLVLAALFATLAFTALANAQSQDSMLIVTGIISGNVVGFNLTNGASVEFVALTPDIPPGTGDRPRGIAVGSNHLLYVSLRGGAQNIKRFWWDGNFIDDFVPSFPGPLGPGQMEFTLDGDLIVGGDEYENSSVLRYDGTTGELLDRFRVDGFTNLVGILVDDPYVYAAATFQYTVLRFDLSQEPVTGTPFITCCTGLPVGMAMSHRGTILVTQYTGPLIQEFDGTTGEFVGTFADLSSYGIPGGLDITYDLLRQRYYFTAFDRIFEFDHSGNVTRILTSPLISGAHSLTIATPPISLSSPTEPMSPASALTIVPNPTRGTVTISIDSRADEHPRFARIYDVAGRMVRQLEESPHVPGYLLWDGRDSQGTRIPAGTYFVRVNHSSMNQKAKIVLLP